ncbi:hypothetical protein ACHQM5_021095 [Ranunculus cassubicifolius]
MEELPPGYRFYPTEEELVSFYLREKLDGIPEEKFRRVIPVVDIYEFDPCQLPQISGQLCHGDPEQWFFFCPRQEREARGGRPNRITGSGYWKATGSPGFVFANNRIIGVKKTMVFYEGKAPSGNKTKWKMIEYKAIQENEATSSSTSTPQLRHEFSVCRVYINSGSLRAFDRRPLGPTQDEGFVDPQGQGIVASPEERPGYQQGQGILVSSSHQDSRVNETGSIQTGDLLENMFDDFWGCEQFN